jgi:hypothetical protein
MTSDYSRYRPHPWHGLRAGSAPPSHVDVYVEITPFDLVKYEVDKSADTCAWTARRELRRFYPRSTDSFPGRMPHRGWRPSWRGPAKATEIPWTSAS